MHVLVLPSWYFPSGSQEIAGRMFHHLASGLREEGIDARVLYADYSTRGDFFKKSEQAIEAGVPTWRNSQFYPPKRNKPLITWWKNKYLSDILNYIE